MGLLITAAWLTPNRRGMGTHQQLGLPACTIVQLLRDAVPVVRNDDLLVPHDAGPRALVVPGECRRRTCWRWCASPAGRGCSFRASVDAGRSPARTKAR